MTTNHAPRNAANPFVIVSSDIARNPDLSAVECRIMTILLNLPQGWQPNAKHLSTQMLEGTSAIQRAIARLKQLGYLVCRLVRDAAGRFSRSDWEINEIPKPPTGENLDAHGNVVTFDCGGNPPKNLCREAKQQAKIGRKTVSEQQSETLTAAPSDPYLENPDTGYSDRSNIDIQNIQKDLEREAVFENFEETPSVDIEGECQIQKKEFFASTGDSRSDKRSATAEVVKGRWTENQLREFQSQLEEYGRRAGRRSPLGWAFTIVKNLREGIACTYWEEFKAGLPLGTSEQREWEVAPGVACAIAIQCLEQDFLARPGTTPQEAALKTARTIANPNQMKAVWETIKARVMFQKRKWDEQSALGVEHPAIDFWMTPKPAVTVEEIVIALNEIQSALPPALQPSQDTSHLLPIDAPMVGENVEVESAIAVSQPSGEDAEIVAEAKTKIVATLRKFARPNKKRATLDANIAEVDAVGLAPLAAKKSPNSDGLADYLRQLEVEDEEIW